MVHIDFLTVLVAAIVYFIIKTLWYSSYLFGNLWFRLRGLKKEDVRKKYIGYPLNFIIAYIIGHFISLFEIYVGATSFWDGVVAGFILWLGFVFITQISEVIWVKRSYKVFLIRNGFFLLAFMVMGAILVG